MNATLLRCDQLDNPSEVACDKFESKLVGVLNSGKFLPVILDSAMLVANKIAIDIGERFQQARTPGKLSAGDFNSWLCQSTLSVRLDHYFRELLPAYRTLLSMQAATGYRQWLCSDGWLVSDRIHNWHGVHAEGTSMAKLDLRENNLCGLMPGMHVPPSPQSIVGLTVVFFKETSAIAST